MAALLALTAAAAYGVGDFLGGIAARREPSTAVVLWSHIVGLATLLAAAPAIGGDLTPRGLAVGGVAGLVGGVGVALLYRGLSIGSMSVVAPIAALLSGAVPVLAGIGSGERPPAAAVGGIGLALVAVTLVSREPGDHPGVVTPATRRLQPLLLALGAGVAFGLFFVALDRAGSDVGIWPLVGARVASVSLFAALGAARVTAARPPRAALGAAFGCGLLDAAANVLYVLALTHGLLSVVAVLTALYPAGTVLLARYVLGERLTGVQRTGLAVAGLAAVLIAS
ncbi:MAG TPA: DMT family transporter [Acidimicrobiales bacterium]|jgi:drug/metabolite transporter (DMT)-like permease|nr:DMT family transporter [Acidimicrobiales bacterium]